MYLIRLDDASEHMELDNWMRMKKLLDKYGVKPIYGIIPNNQDPELLQYEKVADFWELMRSWQAEGWIPAMHGYNHVFETEDGGINPVNKKSEFAGVPFERQKEKIREGFTKLMTEGIKPDIFFAPAHTFDPNTLKAIYQETPIRIISDTIANDIYYKTPFYFIPQQCGRVRRLPFKTVTFCYHPNLMMDKDFIKLEHFLRIRHQKFGVNLIRKRRKENLNDILLGKIYFILRKGKILLKNR